MHSRYLEITFRKGKPLAGYLYLAHASNTRSARSETAGDGIVMDFGADGQPIGIEITAPSRIKIADINELLHRYGLAPVSDDEMAPLLAA